MFFKRNFSAERMEARLLGHSTVHIFWCRTRGHTFVITQEIRSGRWSASVCAADAASTRDKMYLGSNAAVSKTIVSFSSRQEAETACDEFRKRIVQ